MLAVALDSWQGCFEAGDQFEVLAVYTHYILIKETSGRLVWNYFKLFELIGTFQETETSKTYKFKINWDIV